MKETKEEKLKVAHFGDTHSHGYRKIKDYDVILMEVKEGTASEAFTNYFNYCPDAISCECCGEDFIYDEYDDIMEATSFERERYGKSLEEYLNSPDVLFVPYTLYKEKMNSKAKEAQKMANDLINSLEM